MFILLLESPDNFINSVTAQLQKKFPKSCQGFINESVRYDSLARYKVKPLLAGGWLLHCNSNLSVSYLKHLQKMPTTNLYLFTVESKRVFNELKLKFDSLEIDCRMIDNSVIPKAAVLNYIMEHINISYKDANYLYKRHGGYLRDIMASMQVLQELPVVSRVDIRKYTVPSSRVRLYDIMTYLVNPNSSVSYGSIITLVYQYQYGLDYLLTYLKEQLNLYICVFSFINDGVINITNYKDVRGELHNKQIEQLSDLQLKKIIESFDYLSFDKLYIMYQYVAGLTPDRVGLLKLIEFLKVNKEA